MQYLAKAIAGLALTLFIALPATAHHGWGWTSEDWFELTGTITEVYVGNPHATLEVEAEGQVWEVDLAPLSRTLNAGFDENVASAGDDVTLIGHRSTDANAFHMKAVRIIIGDETYDVYPGFAADYDRQANT